MTIPDALVVLATLAGPILAVQAQKWLERTRERRQRKLAIFQVLMTTRTSRTSREHVQALNMIEFEFGSARFWGQLRPSKTEQDVVDAWHVYRKMLNDPSNFKDTAGTTRREDALVELLLSMSRDLAYRFDRVELRDNCYSPVAHAELEQDGYRVRKLLVQLLEGRQAIPIRPVTEADLSEMRDGQTDAAPDAAAPQLPRPETGSH